MTELVPRFTEFCETEVLPQGFDYLVPIESKGMLLLEEALSAARGGESRILFRRAFDFMDPEELKSKSAALLDDTVFVGRTLHDATNALHRAGFGHESVKKFAFILNDDLELREYRQLEGITFCCAMDNEEYVLMVEELSQLALRSRPSHPDHLVFDASFRDYRPPDDIVRICRDHGMVVEYRRPGASQVLSIHYPSFAPDLPPGARDTGANKMRVALAGDGQAMRFAPEIFPTLVETRRLSISQYPLWQTLNTLLDKPGQEEAIRRRNLYESFTLSLRIAMAREFVATLRARGLEVDRLAVVSPHLTCYYGPRVARQIVELASAEVASYRSEREPLVSTYEGRGRATDTFSLTYTLLSSLYGAYQKGNERESDRFRWRSVGLDIEEICAATGYDRFEAALGIESLNDYGYATPLTTGLLDSREPLARKYRSTELGRARLVS